VAGRFAGPSPTPVASFNSNRRPGLRPITPTAELFGVIAPKASLGVLNHPKAVFERTLYSIFSQAWRDMMKSI